MTVLLAKKTVLDQCWELVVDGASHLQAFVTELMAVCPTDGTTCKP